MRQINPGRLGLPLTGQLLSGTIDGANTVFSTTRPFLHTANLQEAVYLRGLRRCEGVGADYLAVESGGLGTGFDTVVFTNPPRVGDTLLIDYYPSGP
jgi:hypothetical protein